MLTRVTPIVLVGLLLLSLPHQAQAQSITVPWSGNCIEKVDIPATADAEGRTANVATIQGLGCMLANILSIGVTGIGLAGFVMFLVGSFSYLLSGGNSKTTEQARGTFTYAVIGLVVALSAIIILRIIVAFTGVQRILQFEIPSSDAGLTGPNPIQGPLGPAP